MDGALEPLRKLVKEQAGEEQNKEREALAALQWLSDNFYDLLDKAEEVLNHIDALGVTVSDREDQEFVSVLQDTLKRARKDKKLSIREELTKRSTKRLPHDN